MPRLSPPHKPGLGTDYLEVETFIRRLETITPGESVVYATGDLAFGAQNNDELARLRATAWLFSEQKKITLTPRICADRRMHGGGRAFHYIATKLGEKTHV